MFIGIVVELAIEIAVGIIFTGGVLSLEAIMAKLGETFKALGNLLIGALKLPFKVAEKSISSLLKSLKWLYEFLSKGTDEIVKLVDEVFGNMKQVAADLAKKFVDDVPNLSKSDLDWMASRKLGNLGGAIVKSSQLRKLRGILKEKNIHLIIDGDLKSVKKLFKPVNVEGLYFDNVDDLFRFMQNRKPPLVGGFDAINKQFILPKTLAEDLKLELAVTEIIVFHEMAHLKHFEEIGTAYHSLNELQKETYVWKQIIENRGKWTNQELEDALDYINRIRANPKYGNLKPIKIN